MSRSIHTLDRAAILLVLLASLWPIFEAGQKLIAGEAVASNDHLNPVDRDFKFKDSPWAGSTGFLSIANAQAFSARPRWSSIPPGTAHSTSSANSLAIIGLPVDFDHAMLSGNAVETFCLARQKTGENSFALCSKDSQAYGLFRRGPEYTLCDFDDDCWHSTAAALLSSGRFSPDKFSFDLLASLAFKDGRDTLRADKQEVHYPVLPEIYKKPEDIPTVAALTEDLDIPEGSTSSDAPPLSTAERKKRFKQLAQLGRKLEQLPQLGAASVDRAVKVAMLLSEMEGMIEKLPPRDRRLKRLELLAQLERLDRSGHSHATATFRYQQLKIIGRFESKERHQRLLEKLTQFQAEFERMSRGAAGGNKVSGEVRDHLIKDILKVTDWLPAGQRQKPLSALLERLEVELDQIASAGGMMDGVLLDQNLFEELREQVSEVTSSLLPTDRQPRISAYLQRVVKSKLQHLIPPNTLRDHQDAANSEAFSKHALVVLLSSIHRVVTRKRIADLALLPSSVFPSVSIFQNRKDGSGWPNPVRTLINRNILQEAGVREGAPIHAFNVFSRVDNAAICAGASRKAPCVLSNDAAQEQALQQILAMVTARRAAPAGGAGATPGIAAVMIIAGGPLTAQPCNGSKTATYISDLRKLGVYTFVPVGNDGDPRRVRTPACVDAAVKIGALDRSGMIASYSNGRETTMIDFYVDGDTVALPLRTAPINQLACMSERNLRSITKTFQAKLTSVGLYSGTRDGVASPAFSQGLSHFQKRFGLAVNGNIDVGTALAFDKIEAPTPNSNEQQHDAQDDDARFPTSIADNLKYGYIKTLAGYSSVLCEKVDPRQFYQVRLAGGTLVSAAAAAAQFLALKDQVPELLSDKVFETLMNVAKARAVPELQQQRAGDLLRASAARAR